MPSKQAVKLTRKERHELLRVATVGVNSARMIVRAQILLKVAEGWTDETIADAFNVSCATVRRTRLKGSVVGAMNALEEAPRSGQPRELSASEEQLLVALACSKAPAGYARWTVRLLTSEAIKRGYVHKVAPETVRQILQKTQSNPGK
jgi:transposase